MWAAFIQSNLGYMLSVYVFSLTHDLSPVLQYSSWDTGVQLLICGQKRNLHIISSTVRSIPFIPDLICRSMLSPQKPVLEEHLHWWPFHKKLCIHEIVLPTSHGHVSNVTSPVFWMQAMPFVIAALSLFPTMFSEITLKLYEFPITRSETVTLSLWKCSRTVNHSCHKQQYCYDRYVHINNLHFTMHALIENLKANKNTWVIQ